MHELEVVDEATNKRWTHLQKGDCFGWTWAKVQCWGWRCVSKFLRLTKMLSWMFFILIILTTDSSYSEHNLNV